MLHLKNQFRISTLSIVLTSVLLSACGGGGSSSPVSSSNDVDFNNALMKMSGTIVVEERNGKTVFDGWFMQGATSDITPVQSVSGNLEDTCHSSLVNIDNILASSSSQSDNSWSNLQSIDGSAGIQSRAGQFESLVVQQIDDTTVYAPSERWQSDALPDDAVLSFESESVFGKMSNVDVPPLLPLVWLAPETGVMSNAATMLRWEPSLNDEVRINLKLSAIDFSDSENPVASSIDCSLVDDGQFTLSDALQQTLPDDHTGIVVYAVRERVQQIENEDTSLTVVQLSYPAPL